jgi:hypothetical protein
MSVDAAPRDAYDAMANRSTPATICSSDLGGMT